MQLDPAVVNQWILQIGRDELDPRDVAEDWIAANMDVVEGWIK
jgi:glycine betaine/proline transport system substrate-binding protein